MNGFENAVKSGAALSPDVIVVCVKGYSITDAIPFIKSVSKPETVVIPILNIYGTGRHAACRRPPGGPFGPQDIPARTPAFSFDLYLHR